MVRALNDVNLPKFLSPDLPLFSSIVSDLFPSIGSSGLDDSDTVFLTSAIKRACAITGLQATPSFVSKVLQVRQLPLSAVALRWPACGRCEREA